MKELALALARDMARDPLLGHPKVKKMEPEREKVSGPR